MRIGIYDPYLDTLGGGERYVLTAASCLSHNHQVEIFWNDPLIINSGGQKLNIDLSKVKTVPNIFTKKILLQNRLLETRKYDRIIFLSDGSIPLLLAKKNILLFHHPVNWIKGGSIKNKLKLKNIYKIICYTNFVKDYLDKTFNTDSQVLYPPVEFFGRVDKKENIILSVGRFTKSMNAKKQDILIEAFKKIYKTGLKNWKLVLIGSYLSTDEEYVLYIKKIAQGYPIEVITNATFTHLKSYYQKAKIYWHAAGYGEDLDKHPERAEHFGISTVEAMGAGAVPVVINAGGQTEIVNDQKNGFLWNDIDELINKTKLLIGDSNLAESMSREATRRAKDFNIEKFCKQFESLMA